jgi:hypothetical protein
MIHGFSASSPPAAPVSMYFNVTLSDVSWLCIGYILNLLGWQERGVIEAIEEFRENLKRLSGPGNFSGVELGVGTKSNVPVTLGIRKLFEPGL